MTFLGVLPLQRVDQSTLTDVENFDASLRQVGLNDNLFCHGRIAHPAGWNGECPPGYHDARDYGAVSIVTFLFEVDSGRLHRTQEQMEELRRTIASCE